MRHSCVLRLLTPTSRKSWMAYLAKAHPGTFDTVFPLLHALPPEHNIYLLINRPSATGTWATRYGYTDWSKNEAHFPLYYRPYLRSTHLIRSADKEPPKLSICTWDEEVAARDAAADATATPLRSPNAISQPRKKARFDAIPATVAPPGPDAVTPSGPDEGVLDVYTPIPRSHSAPTDLFGARDLHSTPTTPASQWSVPQSVSQASSAETKRQAPSTWTFRSANRSQPEQGCYHYLSGLLATQDVTFIGSTPQGNPVIASQLLFPGNINLPFRRDFLAQVDPAQAGTWLRGQYYNDRASSRSPELCPDIQVGFFNRESIDMLRREFLCGQELTPEDLQRGSSILIWFRSLPSCTGPLFPSTGPPLHDAQVLLSNIQWFLELSVADFSPQPTPWNHTDDSPFQRALVYQALKDLNSYFLSRHLQKDWNASASSRRRHFWIFACMLHQLFALFDRWRKQDSIVEPVIPDHAPAQ
jgi:hypothetical protein